MKVGARVLVGPWGASQLWRLPITDLVAMGPLRSPESPAKHIVSGAAAFHVRMASSDPFSLILRLIERGTNHADPLEAQSLFDVHSLTGTEIGERWLNCPQNFAALKRDIFKYGRRSGHSTHIQRVLSEEGNGKPCDTKQQMRVGRIVVLQ